MKDSSQRIVNAITLMTESVVNKTKTVKEAEEQFAKIISKEQLLDSLTDDTLDSDDIKTCHELLKKYFNYEVAVN